MIDLPAPVSPLMALMPASSFEIQVVDDGVVVNGQVHQHGERSRV